MISEMLVFLSFRLVVLSNLIRRVNRNIPRLLGMTQDKADLFAVNNAIEEQQNKYTRNRKQFTFARSEAYYIFFAAQKRITWIT